MNRREALRALGAWIGMIGATAPLGMVSAAPPDELSQLLSALAQCPGLEADFEEEKRITLLKRPLKATGKLFFAPQPGALARQLLTPQSGKVVVTRQKIVLVEDGKRREVDLSDKPPVRALVTSLLHLLGGERAALERDFKVHFAGTRADGWQLRLVPARAPLDKLLRDLQLSGRGTLLQTLVVRESSGDETHTRFVRVNPQRRFSADERRQIFELD